jgi:hypothetical protein
MNISEEDFLKIWKKGSPVSGYDSLKYRKDKCGAMMYWNSYGNKSNLGWHLDHISPKANGGKDIISNLRPLNWLNNIQKSNGRLKCNIRWSRIKNKNIEVL